MFWCLFVFFIVPKKQVLTLHIDVSNWNNFYEMLNPVFWEKQENVINLSSAELAQR